MVDHKIRVVPVNIASSHVGYGSACSVRDDEWKGIGFRGRYLPLERSCSHRGFAYQWKMFIDDSVRPFVGKMRRTDLPVPSAVYSPHQDLPSRRVTVFEVAARCFWYFQRHLIDGDPTTWPEDSPAMDRCRDFRYDQHRPRSTNR